MNCDDIKAFIVYCDGTEKLWVEFCTMTIEGHGLNCTGTLESALLDSSSWTRLRDPSVSHLTFRARNCDAIGIHAEMRLDNIYFKGARYKVSIDDNWPAGEYFDFHAQWIPWHKPEDPTVQPASTPVSGLPIAPPIQVIKEGQC